MTETLSLYVVEKHQGICNAAKSFVQRRNKQGMFLYRRQACDDDEEDEGNAGIGCALCG
jgi:hypothetical protein